MELLRVTINCVAVEDKQRRKKVMNILFFFIFSGLVGAGIGYLINSSTEITGWGVLLGTAIIVFATFIWIKIIRPIFSALNNAVRDAEESASR